MPKQVKIIDSNLIIRFFAEDDAKKADAVEKLLQKTKKDELELPDVIIAEIVWVLVSFYQLSKNKVLEKLEGLLSLENVKINRSLLKKTIDIYRKYNLSYTDAYLVAYTIENKSGSIYSYDQGLDKVKEINRLEP